MRHSSSIESRTDHLLYPEFILRCLLEQAGWSGLSSFLIAEYVTDRRAA